jgi:hypothetical protein
MPEPSGVLEPSRAAWHWWAVVVLAAACGLSLLLDTVGRSSATYDEVAYLRVAARWWRTGRQDEITRMGSPLTFWKLQQVPVLWTLDRLGRGALIDDPVRNQEALLPLVRAGSLWIWLAAFVLTAGWANVLYGPRAMALAGWIFALSPNLIAHGGLVTMELPLLACTTAMFALFWAFLASGRRAWLASSAAAGGLAFSCKFTAALIPPILAVGWWLDARRRGGESPWRPTRELILGMTAYAGIMLASNFAITGFATSSLSRGRGEHPSLGARFGRLTPWVTRLYEAPLPQDWTGFATQVHHQASGGSSYLLGERRDRGWPHYYLVALAVKLPLGCWLLLAGRAAMGLAGGRRRAGPDATAELLIVLSMGLFLAITAVGSSRNYGLRYLLPLSPLAVVWVSKLAEGAGGTASRLARWPCWVALAGLAGQAAAVSQSHPFELTYFNELAGGSLGGRRVLADSNLDWGQGLKGLARLQRAEPRFRDLTLYYFGDTDPAWYGVEGTAHVVRAVGEHSALPPVARITTRYLAVSASLQWGPWGPPGFFRDLDRVSPERLSEDATIAIYRTSDIAPGVAWKASD